MSTPAAVVSGAGAELGGRGAHAVPVASAAAPLAVLGRGLLSSRSGPQVAQTSRGHAQGGATFASGTTATGEDPAAA